MLVFFPELFLLAAHARPPDFRLKEIPRARNTLSGRLQAGEADKLFWVEQDADRLYATEIVDGQLATCLVGEGVSSVAALVDYDGDGRNNLMVSLSGLGYADVETGEVLGPFSGRYGGPSAGDVNGDGFGDFARQLSLWLGHEDGLREGALFPARDDATNRPVHALGDLDGDGRADLARANVEELPSYCGGPSGLEGTLDLYLGGTYAEPTWTPHWSYDHPTPKYASGLALTAANLDGDGTDELLVLSGRYSDGGIHGELQVLDDVLSPLGPTVLVSQDIGPNIRRWPGFSVHNMGDMDGDGDDEVLAFGQYFLDSGFVRIIDAEPTPEGLFQVVEPSFDLPASLLQDESILRPLIGDYDGDGWRDVALMLAWPEAGSKKLDGAIALWLTTPPEGAPPESEPTAPSNLSHCQPPEADTADDTAAENPKEPQSGACGGCATAHPPAALLWLALPWFALRRRPRPLP